MQLIAADVGNSSIKLRQVELEQPSSVLDYETSSTQTINLRETKSLTLDERFQSLDKISSSKDGGHWFVSSVSPENLELLRQQAEERSLIDSWNQIGRDELPLTIAIEEHESVGIDRLLAALAAHHRFGLKSEPTADVIVIDCGTAMTIDLIDANANFRGGVIIAGPATNLLALSNMTAVLPNLMNEPLEKPASVLGQSTKQAMMSGAWHSGWGAIQEVVKSISELTEGLPVVVGTGGGLGPWKTELPDSWIQIEDLVLDGILLAAKSAIGQLP